MFSLGPQSERVAASAMDLSTSFESPGYFPPLGHIKSTPSFEKMAAKSMEYPNFFNNSVAAKTPAVQHARMSHDCARSSPFH
jgi:hypothetical protein